MASEPARGEEYRYDAFISYRQLQPDRAVAEALQRELESFKTPGPLVRQGVPQRLKRVFLDRSELAASPDLEHELVVALQQSRHLVVVCSPRTPESKWIAREVEVFRELNGEGRILLLLLEGEPQSAYPTQLMQRLHGAEPLAADIRAPSLRQSLRRLRSAEKLRLLAPMLGVSFDNLWQRERRRRQQRQWTAVGAAAVVMVTVAGLAMNAYEQARSKQLITAIAALTDNAVTLTEQGRTGLAAALAIQAHRLDPNDKAGMQSQVYAALRRALASRSFSQVVSQGDTAPNAVAVSPDGQWLAAGHQDGSVEVWSLAQGGAQRARTQFRDVGVTALAFMPDERALVAVRDDGEVWRLAIDGGALKPTILGACGTAEALALHPTGRLVVVGTQGEGLCLIDTAGARPTTRRALSGVIRALSFSADGEWLAVGRKAGVALFASDAEGLSESSVELALADETVTALAFGAGQLAAGSHADVGRRIQSAIAGSASAAEIEAATGRLRIWRLDALAGAPLVVPVPAQRVQALAFLGDGDPRLALGGDNGRIWLWSGVESSRALRQLDGHEGAVTALAADRVGKRLVSAGADRTLRLWRMNDPPDGEIPTEGAVLSLAFLGDTNLAAAVKWAQAVEVWALRDHQPVALPAVEVPGTVTSVAADDTNPGRLAFGTRTLLGSSPDNSVRFWGVGKQGPRLDPQISHESDVDGLAFGPKGRWLASAGSLDKAVKIMDTRTSEVRTLALPADIGAIHALAFHPRADPPTLAVAGDGLVVVVDVASGRSTRVAHSFPPAPAPAPVTDLRYSGDGALLATAAPDGRVRLWRAGSWAQPRTTLEPRWSTRPVAARRLALNPVTDELAVGYQDGAVRVWTLADPQRGPLLVSPVNGRPVQALAFHPGGGLLAVGRAGGGIEFWSTLPALVAQGCAELLRDPSPKDWSTFAGSRIRYVEACPRPAMPTPQ